MADGPKVIAEIRIVSSGGKHSVQLTFDGHAATDLGVFDDYDMAALIAKHAADLAWALNEKTAATPRTSTSS